jgi:hypothetical protein
VPIQKCRIDRIRFETGDECRGFSIAAALGNGRARRGGHRAVMFEQNFSVLLLTATQRAADRIEPE